MYMHREWWIFEGGEAQVRSKACMSSLLPLHMLGARIYREMNRSTTPSVGANFKGKHVGSCKRADRDRLKTCTSEIDTKAHRKYRSISSTA